MNDYKFNSDVKLQIYPSEFPLETVYNLTKLQRIKYELFKSFILKIVNCKLLWLYLLTISVTILALNKLMVDVKGLVTLTNLNHKYVYNLSITKTTKCDLIKIYILQIVNSILLLVFLFFLTFANFLINIKIGNIHGQPR